MDLFVPAKPPLGVQDKAAGPKNPGWLQGAANAVMRAQRGFPSGLAPNPCAACVALLGKAASLAGAVRLVSTRIRSQRGDEQVHDTLQTLSDNRASPDCQKVVHAYREIAAGAPRSPCRLTS